MSAPPASLIPRPLLFWTGVALTCAGVAEHLWMFIDSASMHFHMSMMDMSPAMMWAAMAAIVVGVVLSGIAVVQPRTAHPAAAPAPARITAASRRRLIAILTFALLLDQMKPATLAFISPGLRAEYGLSAADVAWLGERLDGQSRRFGVSLTARDGRLHASW